MSLIILMLGIIFLLITLALSIISTSMLRSGRGGKLPPGPRPLPVIGNLQMLTALAHHSLRDLAQKHGPIMSLRLGQVWTVVASSSAAAQLFLKAHDTAFCSRPHSVASDILWYGTKAMVFTPYGPYWRAVRRLCMVQLLSPSKIESFSTLRGEESAALVAVLRRAAMAGEVVDLGQKVSDATIDLTCRTILGTNLDARYRLKDLIHEIMCIVGSFNLADYMPFLALLDLQGLTRKTKKLSKAMNEVFEKIITEHEKSQIDDRAGHHPHNDFVDVLLSLMHQPMNPKGEHTDVVDQTNIKAILLDMLIGGFDTSSTTINWTLAELFRNPRVMKKLQAELGHVVGMYRMVKETDLKKLHYLDMVLMESFRLHPAVPLLIPRESLEETIIEGYRIPKNTRIIVNTWAMGRDPSVWPGNNVDEFYPERFIGGNVDLSGSDFQILPFGSGRRVCPGMNLGLTNIRFLVAQLVHCFEWEIPGEAKDIDMTEKFGLSVIRASPLLAKPTYRLLN